MSSSRLERVVNRILGGDAVYREIKDKSAPIQEARRIEGMSVVIGTAQYGGSGHRK